MGGCCSIASTVGTTTVIGVAITLMFTGLRYDPTSRRITCDIDTNNTDDVSVSWTKNGAHIQRRDVIFHQSLQLQWTSGANRYHYQATLTASNSRSFEGNFACIANYDGKTKQRTITLSAPPPPRNLREIDTTANSITIAWDAPLFDDSNGNSIVAYRVAYGSVSHNLPATTRRYVAHSLLPITIYPFSVYAVTVAEGRPATIEIKTREGAPSAPLNVRAFNTSSTSLRIEWSPPSSPNGVIRGYRITYFNNNSPAVVMTQDVAGNITSYELTGLEIFTTYSISIQGRTILPGEASDTVTATTEEDAPSPPTILRAFNTSSTSLRVEWAPPDTPNGIIRSYLITYFKTNSFNDSMTQLVAGNETSYELTGLEIFTTYSISIQGQTILPGEASNTVNATTEEDAPSPPTTVRVFNTSSTSLRVQWNPPATPNGIIRGYQITYASLGDPLAMMTQDVAANETSYELTGLEIFTTYTVSVQGRTIILGNSSAPVNATTNEDAPSPPTIVQVFNTSSTSLRVEWIPPLTPNGIIRGYQITYYPLTLNNSPTVMTLDVDGDVTSYELTGLEIFTTYVISIQGRTILLGDASNTVNVTTDEDVPTPPINVMATDLNSTSIQITWTQPTSPNGILLHYTLYYRHQRPSTTTVGWDQEWQMALYSANTDANLTISTYTYILTGLMEYTQYEIVVTASTRIGESVQSPLVTVTTDPESSDPPTAVSAVPINSSAICISWGFPKFPRGQIRGYIINYGAKNQTDGFANINVTLETINDMRNQTFLINGLQELTCYWFNVGAYSFSQPGDPFQIHHGLKSQRVVGCTLASESETTKVHSTTHKVLSIVFISISALILVVTFCIGPPVGILVFYLRREKRQRNRINADLLDHEDDSPNDNPPKVQSKAVPNVYGTVSNYESKKDESAAEFSSGTKPWEVVDLEDVPADKDFEKEENVYSSQLNSDKNVLT